MAEQTKALVYRFVEEVLNKHTIPAADDMLTADHRLYVPGAPEPVCGLDA